MPRIDILSFAAVVAILAAVVYREEIFALIARLL